MPDPSNPWRTILQRARADVERARPRFRLPGPPPMPIAPPAPQRLKNESLDYFHPYHGPDTVAQIGGIINAETGGMRDSPRENESLAQARRKIADVRLNGIRRWVSNVQRWARMAPPRMTGPDYADSLNAARQATRNQFAGFDPTADATHYNMRTPSEAVRGGNFKIFSPHTESGPYQSPTKYDYIWTYGGPRPKSRQGSR